MPGASLSADRRVWDGRDSKRFCWRLYQTSKVRNSDSFKHTGPKSLITLALAQGKADGQEIGQLFAYCDYFSSILD